MTDECAGDEEGGGAKMGFMDPDSVNKVGLGLKIKTESQFDKNRRSGKIRAIPGELLQTTRYSCPA